jgi:hypothetical protein
MSTWSSWYLAISEAFGCLAFGQAILQVHLHYLKSTFFAISLLSPPSFGQTSLDESA